MFRKDDSGEKGFVLILALVTMVAMTLIGISLVSNMTTDIQLSRNERESKIAFQLAEAGINEAIARTRLATNNGNYAGEPAGSVYPRNLAWTTNFTSYDGLAYNVTVRYLGEGNSEGFCDDNDVNNTSATAVIPPAACDDAPEEAVMYGQDFNINSSVTKIRYGKLPVYRITSTGTVNNTTRTVEAFIGGSSINTDTEYGLNTNGCINVSGGPAMNLESVIQSSACGACNVPNPPGCNTKATSDDMNTFLGDTLDAIIELADERHQCLGANCNVAGDDIPSSGFIDGVISDWGTFNGTHSTMIYINNAGGNEVVISGNFTGRGILLVTGDLRLSGGLQYEGLIYVLGTLTVSGGGGGLNVLGGAMAGNAVDLNGGIAVDYDQATLLDVARQHSSSAMIVWKRL